MIKTFIVKTVCNWYGVGSYNRITTKDGIAEKVSFLTITECTKCERTRNLLKVHKAHKEAK